MRHARAAATVALALLATGCASGSDPSSPAGPPVAVQEIASKIAFTVNRDGFGEIWVMDPDGKGRTALTPRAAAGVDASGSTSPTWSPDGKMIAFASTGRARTEDQNDTEIYRMAADGTGLRRLTRDRTFDATPAWSPDGKKIVFAHVRGLGGPRVRGGLVVMDPGGGGRLDLTKPPPRHGFAYDIDPAWSPDGSVIAFTRVSVTDAGETRTAILTVSADGRRERVLVPDAAGPAWSPDGRELAYTSDADGNGQTCFHECSPSGEIYITLADGSGRRRLTKSVADDDAPTWAPDGSRVAFVSDRSDRENHAYEIYVMAVDGSDLRRLTTNRVWDLEPAWH